MLIVAKICLCLAFAASIASIGAIVFGHSQGRQGKKITRFGYYMTFAAAALFTIDIVILTVAFFTKDYNFAYVAENMSSDVSSLAWLYKLSGVWAGQSGSLLFWAWLISLFNAWVAYRRLNVLDELSNVAIGITNAVLLIFTAIMFFSEGNNPFIALPASYLDASGNLVGQAASWGMNPLLQHWAMTIHPPTLFIGYAGLTIPFAFALAAIIVDDGSKLWIEIVHKITVFSWLLLGIGIGLGAVWAYVVLGWGGYWAWDPVENASLLPWLIGVALLHSMTVYRRRGGFKKWAIFSACLAFAVVILGTFITRSGVVQSVHAFGKDAVAQYLFGFMVIVPIIAGGVGLAIRGRTFESKDEFESFTSRDAAYYINNVVMIVATLLIAIFTLMPAVTGRTYSANAYNAIAAPVGVLYCAIIAVCPLLSWGKTEGKDFLKRIMWPGIISLVLFALLLWEFIANLYPNFEKTMAAGGSSAQAILDRCFNAPWFYNATAVAGLFVACLLFCTTLSLFVRGVSSRMKNKDESLGKSLFNVLFKSRTQSGGYITHLGMAIILVGLVGSGMYVLDNSYTVKLEEGSQQKVSNYTLTYDSVIDKDLSNGDHVSGVKFNIERDGSNVGTAEPTLQSFAKQGQTRLNASVVSEPLRDIFLVVNQMDPEANTANITVKINPLVSWAWAGFGVLSLGTLLAAWPKAKTPEPLPASAVAAKRKKARR